MDAVPPRSWPRLVESLERAPVVRVGDYDYFVHPLTDGAAPITTDLLREAVDALRTLLPGAYDVLLTAEAMGLPVATGLTLATGRPFLVARKRSYGLPDEIVVPYRTGYAQGTYYVNGLRAGQTVAVVDDVVSRGGTVRALAEAVRRAGARLVHVAVLVNKDLDLGALGREIGAPIEAAVNLRVEAGRVRILSTHAAPRLPA